MSGNPDTAQRSPAVGANPIVPQGAGRTAVRRTVSGSGTRMLTALLRVDGRPEIRDGGGNASLRLASDATSPEARPAGGARERKADIANGKDENFSLHRGRSASLLHRPAVEHRVDAGQSGNRSLAACLGRELECSGRCGPNSGSSGSEGREVPNSRQALAATSGKSGCGLNAGGQLRGEGGRMTAAVTPYRAARPDRPTTACCPDVPPWHGTFRPPAPAPRTTFWRENFGLEARGPDPDSIFLAFRACARLNIGSAKCILLRDN